jgi:3-(3-hydroxy-phenyl)propionate hydroxylase
LTAQSGASFGARGIDHKRETRMNDVRDIAFAWKRSSDQSAAAPAHHPVVIVGAGPVGLTTALDLAAKGHRSVIIEKKNALSDGSRAICWAKRTLEIMDRLGVGQPLIDKGVTWKNGKVFFDTKEVFAFDLLPESGHRMPAFINLQQYYFEHYCIEAAAQSGLIDVRWQEDVRGLEQTADGVLLTIGSPEGTYRLTADWVVAADGARSTVRRLMDLPFEGRVFEDQFLICDIKMKLDRPVERWFWFDPPFNRGRSALLHKQADERWRLDFQVGQDADRDLEVKPEHAARRVRSMLGENVDFTFDWISIYRFQSRRLQKFRHGRVLFAGDSAHQVSPFGARGGNSGVQDADNLAWKLDLVLRRLAPDRLMDSYHEERAAAADENLLHTTRSTDFIAPKSEMSRIFRDSALALAETEPFARRLINSGRLSTPTSYTRSSLNGPDELAGRAPATQPGAAALDAPHDNGWLLHALGGRFVGLWVGNSDGLASQLAQAKREMANRDVPIELVHAASEEACTRYGATDAPAFYLIRPDQHVAARWRTFSAAAVERAADRALARS